MKKPELLLLVLMLGGCALTPDYQRPTVTTPPAWNDAAGQASVTVARDWWKQFGSAQLDALMQQALQRNLDLQAALQRVAQARADLRIAGAAELPSANLAGAYNRTRVNPGQSDSRGEKTWSAGLNLSYELDLFGANSAARSAARAAYAGTQFQQDALALVVMGEVATGYFTSLSLEERVRITTHDLKNNQDVLKIVEAKFNAGSVSALDVAQQKAVVANSQAQLASLRRQARVARDALAVLLAQPPQALQLTDEDLQGFTVPSIAAGQPSQLLERRPDIRAAEANLIAANANIGVARAALFPSLNLSANLTRTGSPSIDPAATLASAAASLTAPIFEGGRLRGEVDKTKAREQELVADYRKTILTAFQEVEDALAGVQAAQQQQTALAIALQESQHAYDLSLVRYKAGSIDFQTLLNVQNSLFSAEDALAQARLARLAAAVQLYKALGGGWQPGAES